MTDSTAPENITDAAVRNSSAAERALCADLTDLRARLHDAGGDDALAELHESICRLVSELQAAEGPNNQTGTIYG